MPAIEPKVTLDCRPAHVSSLHAISDRQPQLPLHAAMSVSKFVEGEHRLAVTAPVHVAVYVYQTSLLIVPQAGTGSGPTLEALLLPVMLPVVSAIALAQKSLGAWARGKTRPETRHRDASDQRGRSKKTEPHVTPCARRRRFRENTPFDRGISILQAGERWSAVRVEPKARPAAWP